MPDVDAMDVLVDPPVPCGRLLVVRRAGGAVSVRCARQTGHDGAHGGGSTTWWDEDDHGD